LHLGLLVEEADPESVGKGPGGLHADPQAARETARADASVRDAQQPGGFGDLHQRDAAAMERGPRGHADRAAARVALEQTRAGAEVGTPTVTAGTGPVASEPEVEEELCG